KTLKQIAKEIADKHGYTLVGEISDIRVDRITQNKERDLSFLTKLAKQYGYIFKIAENNLVFYDVSKLKGTKSTQIFYKSDFVIEIFYGISSRIRSCIIKKAGRYRLFNTCTNRTI
ncbi:MAG: hypothetical protein ACI4S3_01625, partial [Candidatus Gastranaerophilaceae bacterium]